MIDPDRAGCCRPILKVVDIVRVGVDGRVPLLFRERSNLPTLIVRSENPGVPLRGFLFRRGSPTNRVCFPKGAVRSFLCWRGMDSKFQFRDASPPPTAWTP